MTKERLREYRDLKREKEQLEQKLEAIEAALYYAKPQRLTGMPSNPSAGNAMEDMAARHLELLDLYKEKLKRLDEELLAIEEAIDGLSSRERDVLRRYYIDGLTWEEVCVEVGYSWRQTHRIHAQALERLREE